MAFSVNSNIGAQQIYTALAKSQTATQKAQLALASGKKVSSSSDDTSGYNIGKRLQAESLVMKSQLANISSAKNFLSTAESALQQVYDKLNEIQAKDADSLDPTKDAVSIQNDIQTLSDEINTILSNTKINGADLLASVNSTFGAGSSSVTINIGAKIGDTNGIAAAYASGGEVTLSTAVTLFQNNIRAAITYIGNKTQVLDSREQFLTTAISNNDAAISQIFDTDTLDSQITASKGQINTQLATSMMAQMNSAPQQLMQLFR